MNMETGTIIPGEGDGAPVDYEAEARKMGWTPKDEFKGDPNHHIDAETFYTRAVEFMPIAKATIKKLSNKIDQMEREQKKASEFFSKSEERAYHRALEDLRAKQEAAVESGDIEAFRAADKEADKLRSEMGKPAIDKPEVDEKERATSFGEWMEANPWYVMNEKLAAYTDAQAQIIVTAKGGILDRSDLDELAEKVKAKFPSAFEDDDTTPKQKRSPVEGAGNRPAQRGGKTLADLPPEARAQAIKWDKQGVCKTADYLKNYQW